MRHNSQNKWHKWLQYKMQPCSLTTASCPWVLPTMSSPLPFFVPPSVLKSSILPCFSYTSGPPPVSLPLLEFPFLTPLWSSVFWSSLDSGIRLCFSVPRLFDFLFFRRTAGFEEPRKESMQDNSPMIGKTLLTYVVSPLTYSTAV